MKAIIKGKRYDTETATEIHTYWNGLSRSDFDYYKETLYITSRGNWFLAGSGGARTRYSEPVGNMTRGGQAITPISKRGAREWLERYDAYDQIQKYFADEIEDA